jgi:hypothetical protein
MEREREREREREKFKKSCNQLWFFEFLNFFFLTIT